MSDYFVRYAKWIAIISNPDNPEYKGSVKVLKSANRKFQIDTWNCQKLSSRGAL